MSGLNNIGFQGLPKPAAKPASSGGGSKSSSFEDVLGKERGSEESSLRREPKNSEGQNPSLTKNLEKQSGVQTPNKKDQGEKTQTEKSPVDKTRTPKAEAPATEGQSAAAEKKSTKTVGKDAEAQSVESGSLPMQPGAPNLNGTPVSERLVNAMPVEPTLVAPGAKDKTIIPQDEGVDSLTRRVVWNDFLRKMKDDLGVSAEDVLAAFTSLSDEELAQPPAETVNTVVAALGLNADQAQTARSYFNELVAKTKSNSMGEELGRSQKQINLTLMSQREMQRKAINRSVDKLQDNFFMKNPEAARMTEARLRQELAPAAPMEMIEVAAPSATAVPGMTIKAPTQEFPPMAAAQQFPTPQPAKAEAKNTIDEMVRQFLSPQAKPQTLKAGEMSAAPTVAAAAPTATDMIVPPMGASAGSLKGMLEDLSNSFDSDSEGDDDYTSDASYLAPGMAAEAKHLNPNGPSTDFQTQLAQAEKTPMSVPELVDKAQVMVHEGGGEMKVTLSNEGMGEVAMKVSVNEGKVQVQMVTESDEAKKLIERQLGELKSSLHANHLSLDTIKIDTASNLGAQLEQQYRDAQRQSTQTAWEQFRQDNQGWRRSFFETPSAKQYKGQADAQRDLAAPTLAQPNARKAYNRRLNLVA